MIYILAFSRTICYFHCFLVFVLVPYTFQFSYSLIMVRFPISTKFCDVALIRGRSLLKGGVYSDLSEKRDIAY